MTLVSNDVEWCLSLNYQLLEIVMNNNQGQDEILDLDLDLSEVKNEKFRGILEKRNKEFFDGTIHGDHSVHQDWDTD